MVNDPAARLPFAEPGRWPRRGAVLRLVDPMRSDDERPEGEDEDEERERRDEERRRERRRRRERKRRDETRSLTDEFAGGDVMVATQSPAPDPGSMWTAILVTAAVVGIAALAYYLLTTG